MLSGDLRYQSIDDVLHWVDATRASGAVEVGRGDGVLTIYFHAGRLTFADRGDRPPTTAEIDAAGIDREMWRRAAARPEARSSVSAALLAEGVPRESVERFALRRINLAVEALRKLWAGKFTTTTAVHPFGTAAGIEVARVYCPPLVGDGSERFDAIMALAPTDRFQVTLNGRDWTALAGLVAPFRYRDLVERLGQESADHLFVALERAELAQFVAGDLSALPSEPDIAPAPEHSAFEDDAVGGSASEQSVLGESKSEESGGVEKSTLAEAVFQSSGTDPIDENDQSNDARDVGPGEPEPDVPQAGVDHSVDEISFPEEAGDLSRDEADGSHLHDRPNTVETGEDPDEVTNVWDAIGMDDEEHDSYGAHQDDDVWIGVDESGAESAFLFEDEDGASETDPGLGPDRELVDRAENPEFVLETTDDDIEARKPAPELQPASTSPSLEPVGGSELELPATVGFPFELLETGDNEPLDVPDPVTADVEPDFLPPARVPAVEREESAGGTSTGDTSGSEEGGHLLVFERRSLRQFPLEVLEESREVGSEPDPFGFESLDMVDDLLDQILPEFGERSAGGAQPSGDEAVSWTDAPEDAGDPSTAESGPEGEDEAGAAAEGRGDVTTGTETEDRERPEHSELEGPLESEEPADPAERARSRWRGRASNPHAEGTYQLVADLRKQMDVPPEAQPSTLRRVITAVTRL